LWSHISPCCWLSRATASALPATYLKFCNEITQRDWRVSQKSIEKGHLLRGDVHPIVHCLRHCWLLGKKTIVHTLRVVLIISEIVEKRSISDFTLGIENHYLMQSFYEKNWEFYDNYFKPILDEALNNLTVLCSWNSSNWIEEQYFEMCTLSSCRILI
jgi:hypothetical protein